MSAITNVKCGLSQKAFDVFVKSFIFLWKYTLCCPIGVMQCMRDTLARLDYTLGFLILPILDCLCLPFLLIYSDMDIFAFIHTSDPTKVKVVEREQKEDEPRLLETTVGRTIYLLLVASDRGESELDASVDKLFDEGSSGTQAEQGEFAGGGPRRLKKRKTLVAVAGGPSHPSKKLREDQGTPSGASVGGKSMSVV
nr:hypothetical protein [Tanacetum cinerariifolium]